MNKFKVVGVSTLNGVTKVRFANDFVSRVKMLIKAGHTDIELIELAEPLSKADAVTHLKTTELMATARFAEAINLADEKYNHNYTVKLSRPNLSLEAIKARAGIVETA
jgi:hypothetical protein